jgi:hypothetical protein
MAILKKDFELRKKWYSNRSSTIYPLDINKGSDFCLLFLNYWKLKNKINDLKMNLRFFDEKGNLITIYDTLIIKNHNEFFLKKIIGKKFKGMVEVEFISSSNLRYPFPGITGFYISPEKFISSVHAAGRILSNNEIKKEFQITEESNFSIKYKKNLITPFFSAFNSNDSHKKNVIKIKLFNKQNNLIKIKIIKNILLKPYENKIFYLKDYFNDSALLQTKYCKIEINNKNIFPRMICGNYHVNKHHYEVTHSFPVQKNKKDYISNRYNVPKIEHMSYLPYVKPKELNLKLRIFPTNLKSKIKATHYVFDKSKKIFLQGQKFLIEPHKKFFEYEVINKKEEFGFFSTKQDKIPSRINTSFIYGNKNINHLDTDIALGFKSIDVPNKFSHWGSFLMNKSMETVILIRKINYFKKKSTTNAEIFFYGQNFYKKIKLRFNKDDYKIVYFSDVYKNSSERIKGVSWIMKCDDGQGMETFWCTFNKSFVSGCHSF